MQKVIIILKTYNQTNFFKHTFCEFKLIDNFEFPENTNYKSKSESAYFYTDKGVYRKSNHWGRVANCRWKITANENYKNQQIVIGFANWSDFCPINSSEKLFFIAINFDKKTAKIQQDTKNSTNHLFTFSEAQNRIKQSTHLLNEDKWINYFEGNIKDIKIKIISDFINSNRTLQEIKMTYK